MRGLSGDRGGIIVGWFTKIAVVLAIVGVIGFEATSVGVTKVQTADLAKSAARAASREWQRSKDIQRAYDAAEAVAIQESGTVDTKTFRVAADSTVTLTVEKEASTLVLYRFGATKEWTRVRESAEARFVA